MARYIDVEKIIKYWRAREWNQTTAPSSWKQAYESFIDELEDALDEDVVPVIHAKWLNDKGLYKCSSCNKLWTHWWAVCMKPERMYKEMKYCPYCGAKMGDKE